LYSRPSQLFIIGIIRCDPLRSIQSKTWKSGARQTREHSEVCKTKLHEGGRGCVTMQYYARGGNHKQQRKMECLLMGEGWCAVGDRNIGHKSPPLSAAVSASAGPTPHAHCACVAASKRQDNRLLIPFPPGLAVTGRCRPARSVRRVARRTCAHMAEDSAWSKSPKPCSLPCLSIFLAVGRGIVLGRIESRV
jgi:hypothetical protein